MGMDVLTWSIGKVKPSPTASVGVGEGEVTSTTTVAVTSTFLTSTLGAAEPMRTVEKRQIGEGEELTPGCNEGDDEDLAAGGEGE